MTVVPGHYAVLSAIVVLVGCGGVVTRGDGITAAMALVVVFVGVAIGLAGFGGAGAAMGFAAAALVVATALVTVVIAVVLLMWRREQTIGLDDTGSAES